MIEEDTEMKRQKSNAELINRQLDRYFDLLKSIPSINICEFCFKRIVTIEDSTFVSRPVIVPQRSVDFIKEYKP